MLYPVVRAVVGSSGGSGTVLYSEDRGDGCQTYVLTNHHVIDAAIHVKEEWSSLLQADVKREVNDPVKVEIFCYSDGSTRVREWMRDEKLDFLIDPKAVPTECFERRKKLRKEAEIRFSKIKKED